MNIQWQIQNDRFWKINKNVLLKTKAQKIEQGKLFIICFLKFNLKMFTQN